MSMVQMMLEFQYSLRVSFVAGNIFLMDSSSICISTRLGYTIFFFVREREVSLCIHICHGTLNNNDFIFNLNNIFILLDLDQ